MKKYIWILNKSGCHPTFRNGQIIFFFSSTIGLGKLTTFGPLNDFGGHSVIFYSTSSNQFRCESDIFIHGAVINYHQFLQKILKLNLLHFLELFKPLALKNIRIHFIDQPHRLSAANSYIDGSHTGLKHHPDTSNRPTLKH